MSRNRHGLAAISISMSACGNQPKRQKLDVPCMRPKELKRSSLLPIVFCHLLGGSIVAFGVSSATRPAVFHAAALVCQRNSQFVYGCCLSCVERALGRRSS